MPAAKGNCYNPNGRPRKPLDFTQFEKLCSMQCTQSEIASWFNLSVDTLYARVIEYYKEDFADVYKRHSENGKCSLRRLQLKLAEKSPAMAIFLGKQQRWLGQTDVPPEKAVSDDVIKSFSLLMDQIAELQERKIDESNISKEHKS